MQLQRKHPEKVHWPDAVAVLQRFISAGGKIIQDAQRLRGSRSVILIKMTGETPEVRSDKRKQQWQK